MDNLIHLIGVVLFPISILETAQNFKIDIAVFKNSTQHVALSCSTTNIESGSWIRTRRPEPEPEPIVKSHMPPFFLPSVY